MFARGIDVMVRWQGLVPVVFGWVAALATFSASAQSVSDAAVAQAIGAHLQRDTMARESWCATTVGMKIGELKILLRGEYNRQERFLPVRVQISGTCEGPVFLQYMRQTFSGLGDFRLRQNDFGEWYASTSSVPRVTRSQPVAASAEVPAPPPAAAPAPARPQPLAGACRVATRGACVFLAATKSSRCRVPEECAFRMANDLLQFGATTELFNQETYAEGFAGYSAGCIGFRADLGGTLQGAEAIRRLLGSEQYTVQHSGCSGAGFPYSVILHAGARTEADFVMTDAVARTLAERFMASSYNCRGRVTAVHRNQPVATENVHYLFVESTCHEAGHPVRNLAMRVRVDPKVDHFDGWSFAALASDAAGVFRHANAAEWQAQATRRR